MIQVKYKTLKQGWKWLTCPCCNKRREFPSFAAASRAMLIEYGDKELVPHFKSYMTNSYGVLYEVIE